MLSNVTKTADCLRGNTQMQDLWLEVEKETSSWHAPVPPPKQIMEAERLGRRLNALEEKEEEARLATMRQQATNFYVSPSIRDLTRAKTDMTKSERNASRQRLCHRPDHKPPRPKSATQLGHVLMNGEHSPNSPVLQEKKTPKSRAAVSSPHTGGKLRAKSKFEGLTMADFATTDWTPSFEYKPAKQDRPWQNLEGFSNSTRTLEARKMDPFADINSFQGNAHSAKNVLVAGGAHVRPLDVKGMLGAGTVQKWKMTLREDFANDNDNASSNLHDAMLDNLRKALASGTGLYAAER